MNTVTLTLQDVDDFVNEETTISVLKRWLNATKIDELRSNDSLIYLSHLVKRALVLNYTIRDTERTKSLDRITINIAVPSRNGKNYASNLRL